MRFRQTMRRWDVPRTVVVLLSGLWLVRLLGAPWPTRFAPTFPDSSSYLRVSSLGPLSRHFWFGERPPTYPLMLWLLGNESRLVVLTQSVAYVAAFVWLGAVMWQRITNRVVAGVAITFLVLIALEARWSLWNTLLLTESLSISLAVAGVAAWWQFVAEPSRFRISTAAVITMAWVLLRDSNAVTLGVVAVPALVVALVLNRRSPNDIRLWSIFGLSGVVVAVVLSGVGQLVSDRGETSFHNNVGLRWLVDDEMTTYFAAHGMPVDDALFARRGGDAWRDGEAFLRDPELSDYRAWADGRGRIVLARSLVERADWWADVLTDDLRRAVLTDYSSYDMFGVEGRLPDRLLGPFDPVATPAIMVFMAIATSTSVVSAWRRRHALGWLVAFLVVAAWSDVYLSLVGDAVEVVRHLMAPLHRVAVVTVVALAIGVDSLLEPERERAE